MVDKLIASMDEEEILQHRSNVFFRCVEDCYEPIMITNKQGQLIYVNPAWSRVYGYSMEEARGQTPRLLRSSHQNNEFYTGMWKQILHPNIGSWRGELVNLAKDGHEVPVLLNITPYKSPEGETIGYMGLALDLSEQKNLEAQMAQQDRLATIGELTSGLAHEIGTPIGVIRGRAEMMQMQSNDNPLFAKSLDIIIRQIDRISNLISSLLRLSRKDSDEPLRPLYLKPVVTEVSELLIQRLRNKNIVFKNSVPDELMALGDRNRLEQVLINLLVNSIHAIESWSETHPEAERLIEVAIEKNDTQVALKVRDTGGGIPVDILDKIFHPFFTTKPTSKGTGLGLSIVYRIVHDMEGTINLETKEGQGTTFFIKLKACEDL